MADHSKIEWTESTWNPVRGCSRVSSGCGGPNHEGGCYAEKIAARFSGPGQPYHGFAERTAHGGRWTGKVALVESALTLPLRWKKPRRIFVNSMSDLFHEGLPDVEIDRVFAVMALAPQHIFQVLTKRPERMRAYFRGRQENFGRCSDAMMGIEHTLSEADDQSAADQIDLADIPNGRPQHNVWLGTSCEDQPTADERIPHLLATPAAVRFISAEPMLGPIDLAKMPFLSGDPRHRCDALTGQAIMFGAGVDGHPDITVRMVKPVTEKLDWVICGGESGPSARPMHPDWARSLRDQCATAGVPYFFKQWGEWTPGVNVERQRGTVQTARRFDRRWFFNSENLAEEDGHIDDEPDLYRVGKRAAGRLLDGREHSEFPA